MAHCRKFSIGRLGTKELTDSQQAWLRVAAFELIAGEGLPARVALTEELYMCADAVKAAGLNNVDNRSYCDVMASMALSAAELDVRP